MNKKLKTKKVLISILIGISVLLILSSVKIAVDYSTIYRKLFDDAGKVTDNVESYSSFINGDFYKDCFDNSGRFNIDFEKNMSRNFSDFNLSLNEGYRNICTWNNDGSSIYEYADIVLHDAVLVNPNGDPKEAVFYHTGTYSKNGKTTTSNEYFAKTAAAMALEKEINRPAGYGIRTVAEGYVLGTGKKLNDEIDAAVGKDRIKSLNNETGGLWFVNEDEKFSKYNNFINSNTSDILKDGIRIENTTYTAEEIGSNKVILGPYKVKFANGYGYNTLSIKITNGSSDITYQLKDSSKNNISTITSNSRFYIVIDKSNFNDNLKIKISNSYRTYGALMLFFGDHSYHQTRCTYKPFYHDVSKTVELIAPETEKDLELPLWKKDMSGTTVSGVTISVTSVEGIKNLDVSGLKTSGSDGSLGKVIITPNKLSGSLKIKIKEDSVNDEWEKMPGEATLTINYNNGKITSKTVDDAHKQYFNLDGDIVLKNVKKPSITIKKDFVDEYNNKITTDTSGDKVQFKITCSTDVTAEVDGNTYTGNATGTVNLGNDKEIKITKISGTGTITVKETKTLDGFILSTEITYMVSKDADGNYVINKEGPATLAVASSAYESIVTNTKAVPKVIYIRKVDKEGNILPNIPFELNIHLARVIMIDNTIYLDGNSSNYNESEFKIYLPGDEVGKTIAELRADHTIVYDNNKDGQVDVSRALTDDRGEIKIFVLEAYKMGDVDLDGRISSLDARLILRCAEGLEDLNDNQFKLADMNQDGYVTAVKKLLRDINGDGEITAADARLVLRAAAGLEELDEYQKLLADVDEDGEVTENDANILLKVAQHTIEDEPYELIVSYPDDISGTPYEGYADSEYCLRKTARLGNITYSTIEVYSKELPNSLYQYEGIESTEKFYYVADKAIRSSSTVDGLIVEYVEAVASGNSTTVESKEATLTSMAESSTDVVITHVNEPNAWPLNILKVDEKGNPLGANFKFTVNINNADKIIVDKQYIHPGYLSSSSVRKLQAGDKDYEAGKELYEFRGPEYYLKTDANGEIVIKKVYAESVKSIITITENALPEGNKIYKKINESMTIGKDIVAGNINLYVIKGNHARIDRRNPTTLKILIIDPIDDLTINLNKIDGELHLQDAVFDVELKAGTDIIKSWPGKITDSEGKITLDGIDINGYLDKQFTITFTEKDPPPGYDLPDNPVSTIKFEYVKSNGFNIVEDSTGSAEFNGTDLTLNIPNEKKKMGLTLQKIDTFENPVANAKFEITTEGIQSFEYEGTKDGNLYVTSGNGEIVLTKIVPDDSKDIIRVTLNEKEAPNGLSIMVPNPLEVVWEKDSSGKYILQEQGTTVTKGDSDSYAIVKAVDGTTIEKLTLQKADKSTGDPLVNAEFIVNFDNKVTTLKIHKDCTTVSGTPDKDGYITITPDGDSNITCKSNGEGKILLKDIEIRNTSLTITMTETKAPDSTEYDYNIEPLRDIKFDITYNGPGKESDGITVTRNAYKANGETELKFSDHVSYNISDIISMSANNYNLSLTWYNVPLITLEGQVWLDGQQGVKNVEGPNGKNDDGRYMPGVIAHLYKVNMDDSLTEVASMKTTGDPTEEGYSTDSNDGKYWFRGLEKPDATFKGYTIKFEYDGINYQDTISGQDSKAFEYTGADEFARDTFNNRFKTITYNSSNDTPLSYTYSDSTKSNTGVSKLNANIDGVNPASADKTFKVRSETGIYTKSDKHVDFGMLKKFFDIKLDMVINSARLTINNKETVYSYDEIQASEEAMANQDSKTNNSSDTIALKLYDSDYRYRIGNYAVEGVQITEEDTSDRDAIKAALTDENEELRVFVTYEVALENQSNIESYVDELAYYYDNNYTFVSAKDAEGHDISFVNDNSLYQIEGKTSARVTLGKNAKNLGKAENEYRQVLYFTFEIKKDGDRGVVLNEFANAIEILSYKTVDGGYIDNDSAPANLKDHINRKWEDDEYAAKALKVTVDQERTRTIEGTVWDDSDDKDGKLDTGKGIKGVTVQLIEIKDIKDASGNSEMREAIWQETISGTNTVLTRNTNTGVTDHKYSTDVSEDGKYKFTGFIPGDYIIRFIYGDGLYKTYTIGASGFVPLDNSKKASEDIINNTYKYNGQDYKSTLYKNYGDLVYEDKQNTELYSVARDNEVRRLEVMDYSTKVDKEIGETAFDKNDKLLQNTWMCAETAKIPVNIDENDTNRAGVTISTVANPSIVFGENKSIKFSNVNFGLSLRPETTLKLEKHITGLTITPNGNGAIPVVDAKADIAEMLNGANVKITTTGTNKHLTAIKDNWWKVETDIEELMQGATLDVEYTYVVKNESKQDYLSSYLVGEYEKGYDNYSKALKDKASDLAPKIKGQKLEYGSVLGEYYYNGEVGSCKPVRTQVLEVRDYLNNDLAFKSSDTMKVAGSITNAKVIENNGTIKQNVKVNTVINNKDKFEFLGENENDYSKKVTVTTSLSASNPEIAFPMWIVEIMEYTNAAGRVDTTAIPGNLLDRYVDIQDTQITPDTLINEDNTPKVVGNVYQKNGGKLLAKTTMLEGDEWGLEAASETIIVSKPTGGDKSTVVQIAIVTTISVALIGIGVFLIKKYVLVK